MHSVSSSSFLKHFECKGAQCEDTCCIGWAMQVDDATCHRYQGTDIQKDVVEEHGIKVMRRDTQTGTCVRFNNGLCSIQSERGTDYLGDACHFFPRITRKLGAHVLMTAGLSCPEIARLSLYTTDDASLHYTPATLERLPYTLKDYCPAELTDDQALSIHQFFVDFCLTSTHSAERTFSIIHSVARSLAMIDTAMWPTATPFYLTHAHTRLPVPEHQTEDPFNLLHALAGLVDASPAMGKPRLEETITDIERALNVTLHRKHGAITTTERSVDTLLMMEHQWHLQWSDALQPILKNWLNVQIANSLFPFAGFGNTLIEVITLTGIRLAIVKLALMSFCSNNQRLPEETETIRIIQSLSRFLEHLSSPEFSIKIAQETGWIREPRMRALIGDI